MNRREFFQATGQMPVDDDLERVNCTRTGPGHLSCGWCTDCNKPRFQCGHLNPVKES